MKNFKGGFTLVELLVAVTILAIISVVAYTSYSGLTDSALNTRKVQDIGTLESALEIYYTKNRNYPVVDVFDIDTNLWGYRSGDKAELMNKIEIDSSCRDGNEIKCLTNTGGSVGGGFVEDSNGNKIGAKGTISQKTLGKDNLSKDLYDPDVGDKKIKGKGKFIEMGLGRYVYAIFNKNNPNSNGLAYNLAYTIKEDDTGDNVTVIVGSYTENKCGDNASDCPETLIGPGGTDFLRNGDKGGIDKVPYLLDY